VAGVHGDRRGFGEGVPNGADRAAQRWDAWFDEVLGGSQFELDDLPVPFGVGRSRCLA